MNTIRCTMLPLYHFQTGSAKTLIIVWLVSLLFGKVAVAQQRQWVTLTNCQLVTTHELDADSFRVRSGTNEYNVRLYFVDAPESNLRYPERTREQAEYFGLTIDDTIKAGVAAAEACRKLLEQPFVVKTRWAVAGGRTREPRYYCIVEVGGTNLAELLVAQGWARTKGVVVTLPTGQKAQDYIETLLTLENKARQTGLGAWANSTKRRQQVKKE